MIYTEGRESELHVVVSRELNQQVKKDGQGEKLPTKTGPGREVIYIHMEMISLIAPHPL